MVEKRLAVGKKAALLQDLNILAIVRNILMYIANNGDRPANVLVWNATTKENRNVNPK